MGRRKAGDEPEPENLPVQRTLLIYARWGGVLDAQFALFEQKTPRSSVGRGFSIMGLTLLTKRKPYCNTNENANTTGG